MALVTPSPIIYFLLRLTYELPNWEEYIAFLRAKKALHVFEDIVDPLYHVRHLFCKLEWGVWILPRLRFAFLGYG